MVYFGDTARVPYGSKSPETIKKYAEEDTEFLIKKGAKIIVVACNTASALAGSHLKSKFKNIPIFEVVGPAVKKAVSVAKEKIGVIGTNATINSKVYQREIAKRAKKIKVYAKACPLLVPLVEEGWVKRQETQTILKTYLQDLKKEKIDTLILACTHYPILLPQIRKIIGANVTLINPAELVAREIKEYLSANKNFAQKLSKQNRQSFFASDTPYKFRELSKICLGHKVAAKKINLEKFCHEN